MHPEIPKLLQLQERDQRINALKKDLRDVPKHEAAAKAQLAGDTAAVEAASQKAKEVEVKIKGVELDIQTRQNTIKRLNDQQFETRKNDEFHQQQLKAAALTTDISAAHRAHRRTTSGHGVDPSRPLPQGTEPPSPVREEVRQRAEQLLGETTGRGREFDKKAENVKTDDGTLESKKSLVRQSTQQVYSDGEATLDNTKELVEKLMKSRNGNPSDPSDAAANLP